MQNCQWGLCTGEAEDIFTLQCNNASVVLRVIILSVYLSTCLSQKEHTANILVPYERAMGKFLTPREVGAGGRRPLPPKIRTLTQARPPP